VNKADVTIPPPAPQGGWSQGTAGFRLYPWQGVSVAKLLAGAQQAHREGRIGLLHLPGEVIETGRAK
jgi:hypothetical protein